MIGKRTVPAREIQASLQSSRTRSACSDCSDIDSRDSESLEKLEGFVILHALHRKKYRVVRFLLAVVQRLLMLTKPAHKDTRVTSASADAEPRFAEDKMIHIEKLAMTRSDGATQ